MQAGKTQIVAGVFGMACLLAISAGSAETVPPPAKAAELSSASAPAAGVKDGGAATGANPAPAVTAAPVPTEDTAWKEERERLRKRIEIRVRNETASTLIPAKVAEELHLVYPVLPAEKTEAQALAEADARLAVEVAAKCKVSTPAELRAQAEKIVGSQCKPGERIQVQWTEGIRRTPLTGRLGTIKPDRFEIDGGWILARDVNPDFWRKISPEAHKAAVDEYIRRESRIQQGQRSSLEEELRESVTRKVMLENRYYPLRVKGKKQIKGWISAADILERELIRRKSALQPVLQAKIEKEVFTDAGYVLEGNDWISGEVIERRKKAAAAAAAAAEKKAAESGEPIAGGAAATPKDLPAATEKTGEKKGEPATATEKKTTMSAAVRAANGEKSELLRVP